jgi:hypothetical protein
MSVSSFLRELLRARMTDQAAYGQSMERYLSRRGRPLGGARPGREEIHDRASLR